MIFHIDILTLEESPFGFVDTSDGCHDIYSLNLINNCDLIGWDKKMKRESQLGLRFAGARTK